MAIGDGRECRILTREEEIAAWEAGDYDALVESVWPLVRRTARRLVSESDAAYDELISIAQLDIAESLKTFDPRKSKFISYSCRFLRSRMVYARGAFRKRQARTINGDDVAYENRESRLDAEGLMKAVRQACTKDEVDLLMAVAEGESMADMARQLGVNRQNVSYWRKVALDKCRKHLDEAALA